MSSAITVTGSPYSAASTGFGDGYTGVNTDKSETEINAAIAGQQEQISDSIDVFKQAGFNFG